MARALIAALRAGAAARRLRRGGRRRAGGGGRDRLPGHGGRRGGRGLRGSSCAPTSEQHRRATSGWSPVPDRDGHLQKLGTAFAAGRPPAVWLINHRNLGGFLRARRDRAGRAAAGHARARAGRGRLLDVPLEAFTVPAASCSACPRTPPASSSTQPRPLPRGRRGDAAGRLDATTTCWRQRTRLQGGGGPRGRHRAERDPRSRRSSGRRAASWSTTTTRPRASRSTRRPPRRGLDAFLRARPRRSLAERRRTSRPSRSRSASSTASWRCSSPRAATCRTSARSRPSSGTWRGFPTIEREATVLHTRRLLPVGRRRRPTPAGASSRSPPGRRASGSSRAAGAPCRRCASVAESPDFLNPTEPPRSSEVFLDQIDVHAAAARPRATSPQVEDAANLALEQAFYGRISRRRDARADRARDRRRVRRVSRRGQLALLLAPAAVGAAVLVALPAAVTLVTALYETDLHRAGRAGRPRQLLASCSATPCSGSRCATRSSSPSLTVPLRARRRRSASRCCCTARGAGCGREAHRRLPADGGARRRRR